MPRPSAKVYVGRDARPDTARFVRKGAALAGAVPAHEHLDRKVHLPVLGLHGARHPLAEVGIELGQSPMACPS